MLGAVVVLVLGVILSVIVYASHSQTAYDGSYKDSLQDDENTSAQQPEVSDTPLVGGTILTQENFLEETTRGIQSHEEYLVYLESFIFPKYEIRTVQSYDGPVLGLIGIDESGQKHLKAYVQAFSQPTNSDWAVYYSYRPGTDSGAGPYFGFNAKTEQLKVLKTVGKHIETWHPDAKRLSPDGLYMLSAYSDLAIEGKKDTTLYLLNLVEDSATPIHTLASGETFVKSFETFGGSPDTIVEWVSEGVVRYDVFRKSSGDGARTVLRTEMLNPVSKEVLSSTIFKRYSYSHLGISFVIPEDWTLAHSSNPLKFTSTTGISVEINYLGNGASNNISGSSFEEKYTKIARTKGFTVLPHYSFPVPSGRITAYFTSEKDSSGVSTLEIVMLQTPRMYTITFTSPVSMKGERNSVASTILREIIFLK